LSAGLESICASGTPIAPRLAARTAAQTMFLVTKLLASFSPAARKGTQSNELRGDNGLIEGSWLASRPCSR
jgi:hypothetical protein